MADLFPRVVDQFGAFIAFRAPHRWSWSNCHSAPSFGILMRGLLLELLLRHGGVHLLGLRLRLGLQRGDLRFDRFSLAGEMPQRALVIFPAQRSGGALLGFLRDARAAGQHAIGAQIHIHQVDPLSLRMNSRT